MTWIFLEKVNFLLVWEHYKRVPLASHSRMLCYCVYLFSVICSYQMKGLNFPGSHDPQFCQFVIDRSRHLLKPVRVFLFVHVACLLSLSFNKKHAWRITSYKSRFYWIEGTYLSWWFNMTPPAYGGLLPNALHCKEWDC